MLSRRGVLALLYMLSLAAGSNGALGVWGGGMQAPVRVGRGDVPARVLGWRHPSTRLPQHQHPRLALRGGAAGGEAADAHEADITAMVISRNYSVIEKQRAQLAELILRVRPADDDVAGPFKAMIYDSHWRDIMSLSMPASELCLMGVMAHGVLHDAQKASSAVAPGVYFVRPSPEALAQIAKDVARGAFESFHIFLSGPTSDKSLEAFKDALPTEQEQLRLECADIHLDYLAVGNDVFELGLRDCYRRMHRSSDELSKSSHMDEEEEVIEAIVNGLYNVISACHQRPIIRAQLGTRAQEIADRLTTRIRRRLCEDPFAFRADGGEHAGAARVRACLRA
jgi:hypothetical protein